MIQNKCSKNVLIQPDNTGSNIDDGVTHCRKVWYKLKMLNGNARSLKHIS